MDSTEYNRKAWDAIATSHRKWFVPPTNEQIANARDGKLQIRVTATKDLPSEWLADVRGKRVLCLAAGGGHQGPLLAAAGAIATVADISGAQLEIDQSVAAEHDLDLQTVQCDMRRLGDLGSFDLVINPCSTNFCSDVRKVWSEAFRVLKPGGELITGFINPINYIFDPAEMENGRFVIEHSIPYEQSPAESDGVSDGEAEQAPIPLEFGHSLADLIGGQCAAGFQIVDFFEDRWGSGDLLSERIDVFIATRAIKPVQGSTAPGI